MLKLEAMAEWSAELLSELRTWEASPSCKGLRWRDRRQLDRLAALLARWIETNEHLGSLPAKLSPHWLAALWNEA